MNLAGKAVRVSGDIFELHAVIDWINAQILGRDNKIISDRISRQLVDELGPEGFWITFTEGSGEALIPDITPTEPKYPWLIVEPTFETRVKDAKIRKDVIEVLGKKYHTDVLYAMLEMTPEVKD